MKSKAVLLVCVIGQGLLAAICFIYQGQTHSWLAWYMLAMTLVYAAITPFVWKQIDRNCRRRADMPTDTERLDFLQLVKSADFVAENVHREDISAVALFTVPSQWVRGNTVREAIDMAMMRAAPPTTRES